MPLGSQQRAAVLLSAAFASIIIVQMAAAAPASAGTGGERRHKRGSRIREELAAEGKRRVFDTACAPHRFYHLYYLGIRGG